MSGGEVQLGPSGNWKVFARAPGEGVIDVTWHRGVPVKIGDWSEGDPFGAASATLTFAGVTIFDRLGHDDLFWLREGVDFDLVWDGPLPVGYPYTKAVWEFYSESFDYSPDGITIGMKGAAYQLDNYLAKAEYAPAPYPYEHAIARQWNNRPDLRLGPLHIEWPDWWTTVYTPDKKALTWLVPAGVEAGQKWTGLVTRRTGANEKVLTSYIQTLLSGMYTERGRWTIETRPGRQMALVHRDFKYEPDASTVVIDATMPGVRFNLSQDWSQSTNVVFGAAVSLQGTAYTGMQATADGQNTVYRPLAAMRQADPITDKNGWLDTSRMRREVELQLPEGLSEKQARGVALAHLNHFADPGLTGTIELKADVRMFGGDIIARSLIRAGMSVQMANAFGVETGVMLHITGVSVSPDGGTVTLTVDSKYRDKLTVDEVRLRGRDALNVTRQLIGGLYEPPIPDQLVPWNYAEGSGYIPSSEKYSAKRLFDGMPNDLEFPYEDWTMDHPPSSAAYKDCYIRIGPASAVYADKNWAKNPSRDVSSGNGYGFPIRVAQQGQIRLIQIAAYDSDGQVMPVPFHFSLYYASGVDVEAMPLITAQQSNKFGPGMKLTPPSGFKVQADPLITQHYPFHDNAWERFNANGTQRSTEQKVNVETAGLIRGWGTGTAKAGYWPGSSQTPGDQPTGLLVDEGKFEFNPYTDPFSNNFINPYSTIQKSQTPGFIYCMIYCDAQGPEPVYFAGRMFRVEPGSSV